RTEPIRATYPASIAGQEEGGLRLPKRVPLRRGPSPTAFVFLIVNPRFNPLTLNSFSPQVASACSFFWTRLLNREEGAINVVVANCRNRTTIAAIGLVLFCSLHGESLAEFVSVVI